MWRIPLSVSERTIPHVAESFEEFEVFLKFFQQLDVYDEENWWAKVDAASLDPLNEEERAPYGNEDEDDEVVWEDSYDEDYLRLEDGDVIDPNDFVAWLVTQPNAKGTLYLEGVARHYVSFLRNTPYKLNVPLSIEECNIFACETVEDFDRIRTIMTNAPNYKEVNNRGHNSFSAGLNCYGRYLMHKSTGEAPPADRMGRKPSPPTVARKVSMPPINLSSEERTAIEMVLETRYTNGFRIDLIELGRLRRFVREITDVDIALSDDELIEAVKMCGTLFESKVYTVSKEARTKIKEVIANYFYNGARIIFYEEFYLKNESWLFNESLVSVDMLIGLVRRLFPRLEFTETFFGYNRASIPMAVTAELCRIWGDDVLLSYSQMAERLPYVPINRIKSALAYNPDYIWNSVEVFARRSKIDVSPIEKNNVRDVAQRECGLHRYVSVMDLPLEDFAERNHELSQTAIHNAAFSVYLVDEYEKRGKIIMRKGESVDALTIMREYCRTLDKVTLDELLEFERDLTGETHRWVPMQAGYDVMVRIDKDTYIADCFVDFDVEGIDAALDHFVHGQYAPLITVTTFAIFPHCGQAWNLFLLESYVRRFSKRFRFESPSVNNRNAGCIVQRYSRMDYNSIMIDAVANSSLILNDEKAVSNFLFDNGYRGSRQKAKLADLIKQAVRQRERRD
ncbi:MAG: hypothetical protein FWE90_03080 [Defluviitaleaceae bacterium]|nr:hypothetical protein [Defluviitaleaceae bacterium]